MKLLYLECNMGASGDMLLGALMELLPDRDAFLRAMDALGLPGVKVQAGPALKCGVTGTHVRVTVHGLEEDEGLAQGCQSGAHGQEHGHGAHAHGEHGHSHGSSLQDMEHRIGHMDLPPKVRENAIAVYRLLAQAEGRVHGRPMEQIHFHEVGSLDAAADIVGVCLLMELIRPDRVIASPIHVGSGQVRCAHGVLPVPAPATAELLKGAPCYGGGIQGELCTPTGAALIRHFAAEFGPMPLMRIQSMGYGMGARDFEAANCLRAILGETEEQAAEGIYELSCNLDDMTPEAVGFACQRLMEAGALDVYTRPIAMKKDRPGVLLSLLCRDGQRQALVKAMFAHTSTLGVREVFCRRYALERRERTVETPHGPVRIKSASGWGVNREKPEYEDIRRIALETGESFSAVRDRILGLLERP